MTANIPFHIIKSSASASTSSGSEPTDVDWTKCFLCEKDTGEKLTCPAEFTERFRGAGYETLSRNLAKFEELGLLPRSLTLTRLDEGVGLEETLISRRARFHKPCSLKYNETELKRAIKRHANNPAIDESERFTRQKVPRHSEQLCIFCDQPASKDQTLHEATQLEFDQKIRQYALDLKDDKLLVKLSVGDLISMEAKYHARCLRSFYNKHRSSQTTDHTDNSSDPSNAAFAELISYMQSLLDEADKKPVFQLSELKKLYLDRIIQIQNKALTSFHSTRFKNKILSYFPQLQAHQEGRDVLLVCDKNVGGCVKRACIADDDDDTIILSKAANIVRKSIFSSNISPFNGSFAAECQEESVAHSLLTLVTMILYGTNIKDEANYSSQAGLSISQLLTYNCVKRRKGTTDTRHNEERETPLPLFLGAVVHSKTRSKDLVDILFRLGLSVSYDRVLGLSSDLGNSAIEHFEAVGAVCPPSLDEGVFTTSAVDNIDHDPSSTTAQTSFHGTGISLFQHPDDSSTGAPQNRPPFHRTGKKVRNLPNSYAVVPAVPSHKPEPVPEMHGLIQSPGDIAKEAFKDEQTWCEHVHDVLTESPDVPMHISWAAYHAHRLQNEEGPNGPNPTTASALLPLFQEDSKSTAMIKHSMNVVREAVDVLNPGQIPVIACDQPLYKIAKEIQWTWPETHGESTYVVMLGGLHIKMTLLRAVGDLLDGSGWTSAVAQAEIATSGTADSFLKVSHVKKTARAHQVTACALHRLQQQAYGEYQQSVEEETLKTFENWVADQEKQSPQFGFWNMVLKVQLGILAWDRAIHTGNFQLYIDSLTELQWLFHSLDHHHYARAVAIHLRDMVTLADRHPNIYAQFCKGHFTVNKTQRAFSRMSLDESHEQNNACVKDDGGAVGLTENPTALLRWMVSGPEMARVVGEFLDIIKRDDGLSQYDHHEETPGTQKVFIKHVQALVVVMTEMGNPFKDTGKDVLALDTRVVANESAVQSIRTMEKVGRQQSEDFFLERLVQRTKPLSDTVSKNKLRVFKQPQKDRPRSQKELSHMRKDRSLFSSLYISCQVRDTDLGDFFEHENQNYPPSLSVFGDLRFGTKSDLLSCLEDLVPHHDNASSMQQADMVIIDGAAIVNMIKPGTCMTFDDYAALIMEYIRNQFKGSVRRVDMVFDVYKSDSLKSSLRAKRGHGTRIRVEGRKKLPGNWADFLRDSSNKSELFTLIGNHVDNEHFPGLVLVTCGEHVRCSEPIDVDDLSPCSQEEADTRMLLHAADGARKGYKKLFVRTVDTDVIVLCVSLSCQLRQLGCESLWVAFGTGKTFRHIDVTSVATALGEEKCKALSVFHALTGSDVTSSFNGKGKRTAWAAWEAFGDVTNALISIAKTPTTDDILRVLPTIERFIVILYDRGSVEGKVNTAREILFTQKRREIENIPPTQDSLTQHLLRVGYQAGYVWGQSLVKQPNLPSPGDFGWAQDHITNAWKPKWMTIQPAGEACRAIIKCGCVKGCKRQCRCLKAELPCTKLCKCGGCRLNE